MNSLFFRSIACILGVFFLFSSIAIGLQNTAGLALTTPQKEVHKHGASPLHAVIQLSFEETEEQREKDHYPVSFCMAYTAFDFKPFLFKPNENLNQYNSSRTLTHPRLYLLIRSLLI